MMMANYDNHHHHRSFPSYVVGYDDVDADDGPTGNNNNNRPKTSNIYDVLASSDCSSGFAATVASGGAVGVRILQQPFDISPTSTSTAHTAFKSPGGMAASLEFPFTFSQYKELQRQVMIFKYMKASIAVPLDLLIPTIGSPSVSVASQSAMGRFSGRADVEPGRCRRTDGKKWRCSRDAAPDQKYCERHLHRGRPRSRKPVELPNKKTRHTPSQAHPSSSTSTHPQFVAQPLNQNQTTCFLGQPSQKAAPFWPFTSVSSYKEPRTSDWDMNELIPLADQQWHHLMQIGTATEGSLFNAVNQSYDKEPLNLISCPNFSPAEDQQRNTSPWLLNPEIVPVEKSPPRGFIDAWSTAVSDDHHANTGTETSDNGKLTLSSLSLSMGINSFRDNETGPIRMGLGVCGYDQENHEYASKCHLSSWLAPASTPGGPLAEVLRPSATASSPVAGNGNSCSPAMTAVSSPSGVLQKALASWSDSSGSSSPTIVCSRAKPEIGLMLA
ncbi:hypothetical protein ES288_A12G279400v1 [Gossypium darwinii]|uniref:Growth-regulating factor n=2 Tax=Gossypium TaxID=3633 RepID=A0A5D2N2A8_GOSTO|nr:hypothetical protein ES288_A12G279400v1 [Gossypium darwinii]TYH98020.1 hypothetical protein ES332_A12G280800v1 [Gossypium tomentosum]